MISSVTGLPVFVTVQSCLLLAFSGHRACDGRIVSSPNMTYGSLLSLTCSIDALGLDYHRLDYIHSLRLSTVRSEGGDWENNRTFRVDVIATLELITTPEDVQDTGTVFDSNWTVKFPAQEVLNKTILLTHKIMDTDYARSLLALMKTIMPDIKILAERIQPACDVNDTKVYACDLVGVIATGEFTKGQSAMERRESVHCAGTQDPTFDHESVQLGKAELEVNRASYSRLLDSFAARVTTPASILATVIAIKALT